MQCTFTDSEHHTKSNLFAKLNIAAETSLKK